MIDLATNLLGQRVLAVNRDSGYFGGSRSVAKRIGIVRAVWFAEHLRFLIELEQKFYGAKDFPPGEIITWWMDSSDKHLVPLPPRGAGTLTWCSHCGILPGVVNCTHEPVYDAFNVTLFEDP